jgi:hypothetical protein
MKKDVTKEDKVAEGTPGIKTLRQKTDEIIELNKNLGMNDPSTQAKIQAMENAIPAADADPVPLTELPDLVERRRNRDSVKSVADTKIASDLKARNEALSEKLNVEKAKDVKISESDIGRPKSKSLNK